ncbi:MAG: GNAT family N-acetyltransferase, partial [Phreatobacter sp.]
MTMAAAFDNGTAVTPAWSKSGRIAHIDIVHDLASAEAVWRGLENDQTSYTPYQRFDFVAAWQRQVGEREGLVPFIVIGYDAERRPLLLL